MRSGQFSVIGGIGALGLMALVAGLGGCSSETDPSSGEQGAAGQPGAAGPAGPVGPVGPAPTTPAPPPAEPKPQAAKAVYTLSNDATANAVVVYARGADGALEPFASYATGGKGSASGLGNQGALVFDAKQNLFFAVNAGDDSISMLSLRLDGSLSLISKISSGGVRPVSVTVSGDVVYALNAGSASSASNISGFRVSSGGLTRIQGSTQPLSADTPAPAQIEFTPDGKVLVVTEKATNKIDTYEVSSGVASAPKTQDSVGATPFGFAFSAGKQLLVSEAFGGAIGAGAASSYVVAADGTLTAASSSVVSTQSAPCWVTVALNHAFVTNTRSNTVSAYTIAADGTMTLLAANGISAETGDGPIDADVTDGNDLLYTLNGRDHSISIFTIGKEGALTKRPSFAGVPEFASGLVAR
jgi:6-phosphogluconolactonase